MSTNNLLLELGTEELPPKALRSLAESLESTFKDLLTSNNLKFESIKWYATPRRLALFVRSLNDKQEDRKIIIKGPSLKVAYDTNGNPTEAARRWAASNKADLSAATTIKTDKGEWLQLEQVKTGESIYKLIPEFFRLSLEKLPVPKLMHWSDKHFNFVRPVHSLCMLYGSEVIQGEIYGCKASRTVNGHRFMGSPTISIRDADSYVDQMRDEGCVYVDYDERKKSIISQVKAVADTVGGTADLDDSLVEEVTSIVENPNIYQARFDERFLSVPAEALVSTMKGDQKYFPIYSSNGSLMPVFAFASNIKPDNPQEVIAGNERVVRPRLADAEFFFNSDRKHPLDYYHQKLDSIIYQKDIGTIAYRSEIVGKCSQFIADKIGVQLATALIERAAYLSKCDLATALVSEFPETQGITGMHYARLDGEDPAVSRAIFESYQPRFSGDEVPRNSLSVVLSLADKICTLVSIMGIGLLPKGDKDPYGLRRAAIGIIRICLENKIELDLYECVRHTKNLLSEHIKNPDTDEQVINYIFSRLKAYYAERAINPGFYQAVLSSHPSSIVDFDKRVQAVSTFKNNPAAENLALTYKRIKNILDHANQAPSQNVSENLLIDPAEVKLNQVIKEITPNIRELYKKQAYSPALEELAKLREPVDTFFENVMVNSDNEETRKNRITLLSQLSKLLTNIADISVLF